MRMLPVPLFDALAGFLGVNESMNAFVGRAAAPGPAASTASRADTPPAAALQHAGTEVVAEERR
jgi:hypothetical protein